MRTPSALSSSLMLSLIIIVAGAMLIIFIQFDRGYKLPNYYGGQNDIIRQTYQKETNESTTPRVAVTPTPRVIPTPIVEQERQQPAQPAELVATAPQTYQPAPTSAAPTGRVTPLTQTNNIQTRQQQPAPLPYDILFDSPWSPYYQPQHFEAMR